MVYPGESLNLHIFEPRYKQLIKEVMESGKPFGIPTVINQKLGEWGTTVRVTELTKTYENGEMDIKTEGLEVFRILETVKELPGKLFSGAIVNYPENRRGPGIRPLMGAVLSAIRELHRLLELDKQFKRPDAELVSYDVAHHAGLAVEEEYELLSLFTEEQRQEYLKRHLAKVLPIVATMGVLRERVKLNGHFKNLSSLDLDI